MTRWAGFAAFIFPGLVLLSAASDCEEVELLQGNKGGIVGTSIQLTAQVDPPKDLKKTLQEAKNAIGKVATEMTEAFDASDMKLTTVEKDFKKFLDKYRHESSADSPLTKNLTDFKALVKKSVSGLLSFFDEASDQVSNAFSAANSTLSMMGQQQSLYKLESVQNAVRRDMADLANISQGLDDDLSGATKSNMGDYIVTMKQKLDYLNSVSEDLTKKIQDDLAAFGGSVVEPFTMAAGNKGASAVGQLSAKSHRMLSHLQSYLSFVSKNIKALSAGLDASKDRDEGFISRVLRNIFGGIAISWNESPKAWQAEAR